MSPSNKKRIKIIIISILSFVGLLIVLVMSSFHLYSFYWMIKIWRSIELGEMSIKLEKVMMYGIKDDTLTALYLDPDSEKKGTLRITLLGVDKIEMSLPEFIEGMAKLGFQYTESWEGTYKGYRTFFFKGKGKEEGEIYDNMIIVPKRVMIGYDGPAANYKYFKPVIDNLEFKSGKDLKDKST